LKLSKKYEKIKEKKLLRGFSFLFCLISGSRGAEKKNDEMPNQVDCEVP
jgi:hypothetical protein